MMNNKENAGAALDKNPMVVSDPLAAFEKEGMVKLVAPAKVNLFLGVGERRPDGFHNVLTVMHALSLHDVLHMDRYECDEGGLQVETACFAREGLPQLAIASEDNIVTHAVKMLAEKTGRTENESVKIRIEKHIPHEAGLGGGSSDAAAALIGAARLWGLDQGAPEIMETARQLGSDVAFFIYGGCALFSGKGDTFEHELAPMKDCAVLVKPDGGVSTAKAYFLFDEAPQAFPENLVISVREASEAAKVPLFNNLAPASHKTLPILAEIESWAKTQDGARDVLLCGSGSASIIVCETFDQACKISSAAQKQGWWARTTAFSSLRAAVVPK